MDVFRSASQIRYLIDTYDMFSIKVRPFSDEEHGYVNRYRRALNQRRVEVIEFPSDTSGLSEFIKTFRINVQSPLWEREIYHTFKV